MIVINVQYDFFANNYYFNTIFIIYIEYSLFLIKFLMFINNITYKEDKKSQYKRGH